MKKKCKLNGHRWHEMEERKQLDDLNGKTYDSYITRVFRVCVQCGEEEEPTLGYKD